MAYVTVGKGVRYHCIYCDSCVFELPENVGEFDTVTEVDGELPTKSLKCPKCGYTLMPLAVVTLQQHEMRLP